MSTLKVKKIDSEVLFENGIISKIDIPIKVLGSGDISEKIEIESNMFSKSAIEKIEKAGGKAIFI